LLVFTAQWGSMSGMKSLTVSISPRKILIGSVTLIIGWISYVSVTAIDNKAEISSLRAKQSADDRQDTELREIRRTLHDLAQLIAEDHHESPPLRSGDDLGDFSAAQMAIEHLVNRKGK
jgi:cell division protein FtsB